MSDAISILTGIGSAPVRAVPIDQDQWVQRLDRRAVRQLQSLLEMKNGFYAFEGALHVLSDLGTSIEKGLLEWNCNELWRKCYEGLPEDSLFFAEDIFGVPFCICNEQVARFDPETGAFEAIASDIEEWSQLILDDYQFWTGYDVAHLWQMKHGPIPIGQRLLPITPFVLGGEYSVANVHAIDATQGMRYRASIAAQIRDMPDGAPVNFRVVE